MRALLALAALLLCGSAVFQPTPAHMARSRETLGMYDGYATPAWVLRGIARTESNETDGAVGDDGISEGRFQHNRVWHSYYAALFGDFNPRFPNDGTRLASCIVRKNAGYFDRACHMVDPSPFEAQRLRLTLCSYRQGIAGVIAHGAATWYSDRVQEKGE